MRFSAARFVPALAGLLFLLGGAAFADDTIWDIQISGIPGTIVNPQGVVVTAVARFGCFVQEPNEHQTYGRQYSGVWVFTNTIPAVHRGDLVDVRGTLAEYYGFTEIDARSAVGGSVAVVGQGTIPAPVSVRIREVNNYGAYAEAYESVLIRVDRLDNTLYAGSTDAFREWHLKLDPIVPDSLTLQMDTYSAAPGGDFEYDIPDSGTVLTFAQGILVYNFNEFKLAPRNCEEDLGMSCRPHLRGAYATNSDGVAVQFGVAVEQSSAENINNYQLTSGFAVLAATRDPNNHKRVFLRTEDLGNGEQDRITARNVISEQGVAMGGPESKDFRTGITPIRTIQEVSNPGSSDQSMLFEEIVTIQGRVIALDGANYYFLQDDDGGPWDAIYVYIARNAPLNIGDLVRVAGQVREYYTMTELGYQSGVDYFFRLGTTEPAITNTLTTAQLPYRDFGGQSLKIPERWESNLVRLESARLDSLAGVAGPYYREWLLFQQGYADTSKMDINGMNGDKSYAACVGDVINVTGVLGYTYNQYVIWPRTGRGYDIQVTYDNPNCAPSGIGEETARGRESGLHGQPNPFNPKTTIRFQLPASDQVRLEILDPAGRLVRTLYDRTPMEPGFQQAIWDGRDNAGRLVGSGTYYARLQTGRGEAATKLVLLK